MTGARVRNVDGEATQLTMSQQTDPDDARDEAQVGSMGVFWWNGYLAADWVPWYDYGMRGLEEEREERSGCPGLEGGELMDALLAKDDVDLGWALGLSRDIVAVPPPEKAGGDSGLRYVAPSDAEGARVIQDLEREVVLAVSPEGLRAAPLRVEWEGPGQPVRIIEFGSSISWTRGTEIRKAIDRVVRERRQSYEYCERCRQPAPPENRDESEGGSICHSCLAKHGAVN